VIESQDSLLLLNSAFALAGFLRTGEIGKVDAKPRVDDFEVVNDLVIPRLVVPGVSANVD
jgi:hypothetical protein